MLFPCSNTLTPNCLQNQALCLAEDPECTSNVLPTLTINTVNSQNTPRRLCPHDLTHAVTTLSLWQWECPFPVEVTGFTLP